MSRVRWESERDLYESVLVPTQCVPPALSAVITCKENKVQLIYVNYSGDRINRYVICMLCFYCKFNSVDYLSDLCDTRAY